MFQIIKNGEIPINNIKVLIYGQPGSGKTSLAFTADNPILLDFDNGSHRARNVKDIIKIDSWDGLKNNIEELKNALSDYNTIIIDTVDKMLKLMTMSIIENNPKLSDNFSTVNNNFALYRLLKNYASNFLQFLTQLKKDIVFVCHEIEKETSKDSLIRPQITGSTLNLILEESDIIGRLFIRNNSRVLDFSINSDYYTKDANIGTITVKTTTNLSEIMSKTKQEYAERIKRVSELDKKVKELINKLKESDINEFNDIVSGIKDMPENIRIMMRYHLSEISKERNFVFNKDKGIYEVKNEKD